MVCALSAANTLHQCLSNMLPLRPGSPLWLTCLQEPGGAVSVTMAQSSLHHDSLAPSPPADSSDDEAVEVHVTVDGAGMISSLQAQAPGSSDGGQGDAPLEKALQAVSQLFQSQGGTGQQEAPRGGLLARAAGEPPRDGLLAFACPGRSPAFFLGAGCRTPVPGHVLQTLPVVHVETLYTWLTLSCRAVQRRAVYQSAHGPAGDRPPAGPVCGPLWPSRARGAAAGAQTHCELCCVVPLRSTCCRLSWDFLVADLSCLGTSNGWAAIAPTEGWQ